MATLDLEDAYLLVPIFEGHRKFLRFQWRNKTYEFTALPFGLSTAPYIFTKILRPVFAYPRKRLSVSNLFGRFPPPRLVQRGMSGQRLRFG